MLLNLNMQKTSNLGGHTKYYTGQVLDTKIRDRVLMIVCGFD